MSNLQVKNVPEGLYTRLKDYAAESNLTISAVVLSAVEKELAKASLIKRLAEHAPVELQTPAAEVLAEVRMLREGEMEYYASDADATSRDSAEEA